MAKMESAEASDEAVSAGAAERSAGSVWVLLAIVSVGLNLRPLYTSVGSTLEAIRADLALTSGQVGLLTTLPSWCMGAVALSGGLLLNTLAAGQGIRLSLAVIAVGSVLRLFADGLALLALTSFIGGVGIAAAQVFTPVVIKHRFPERAATVTAGYTAFMNLGASIAAALTPWLADLMGGWRGGLGIWCVPALVALIAWPPGITPIGRNEPPAQLPWRRPVAWRLAVFLAASSGIYVTLLAWTAPIYEGLGWSNARAGLLLATLTAAQVIGAFAVFPLTWWGRDRRAGLAITVILLLVGLVGVWAAPEFAPWSWMLLIGGGLGGAFPLALVLPMDYGNSPVETGGFTAMGFGLGLLVGGLTPWWIGLLRDLSGDFQLGLGALIGLTGLKLFLALTFHPEGR